MSIQKCNLCPGTCVTYVVVLFCYPCLGPAPTVTISNHDGNDYITGSAKHSHTLTSLMSADATKAIISSENTDSALLGIKNNSKPSFAISVGSFTTNQIKGQQLRIYDDKVAGESITGAGSALTWTDGSGTSVTSSVLNDYCSSNDISC